MPSVDVTAIILAVIVGSGSSCCERMKAVVEVGMAAMRMSVPDHAGSNEGANCATATAVQTGSTNIFIAVPARRGIPGIVRQRQAYGKHCEGNCCLAEKPQRVRN